MLVLVSTWSVDVIIIAVHCIVTFGYIVQYSLKYLHVAVAVNSARVVIDKTMTLVV